MVATRLLSLSSVFPSLSSFVYRFYDAVTFPSDDIFCSGAQESQDTVIHSVDGQQVLCSGFSDDLLSAVSLLSFFSQEIV